MSTLSTGFNVVSTGLKIISAVGILSTIVQNKMENYDRETYEPRYTVSIVMPSFDEENFIEIATMSVRNQNIIRQYPDQFEFILVDSNSRDRTVELAEPYVDKVIIAGKGKLEARKVGTLAANGDVIVSVDADCWYPPDWLNTLLRPFNDLRHPYVVGVSGNTHDFSIPRIPQSIHDLLYTLDKVIIHPTQMPGRNCAYFKWAFYSSGEFDYTVNQQSIWDMLNEEEIQLGRRLSKIGPVIFKPSASCFHLGGAKIGCRVGLGNKEVCETYKVGKDRF